MKCPNCNADMSGNYCEYCRSVISSNKEKIFENIQPDKKYCKYCGSPIPKEAVLCVHCGCQVENINSPQPNIYINNNNNNNNSNITPQPNKKPKSKWCAFFLCLFLGVLGVHKFYEGKIIMGILYLCTYGLCGIGCLIDLIIILCKPNPYYV